MKQPVITIYTKPSCVQCTAMKRKFASAGLEYGEDDALDPDNFRAIQFLGFLSAPVVVATWSGKDEMLWAGNRPDMVDLILERMKADA